MASLPKFDIKFLSAVFVLCLSFACAERDFNFNDSQILLFEPKDEPRSNQHPYAAEVERCHYTETEIVLSLVLKNHDWSDLSDNKKSKLLDKMSKFFAIPKEFIILESITKRDMYEMQKQSIRKGNNKCHNSRRLGRIDLMIGCGSKYFSMGEPIANQIGQQMRDGSIDNISDQNFGWWIIWRKNYKTRTQRNRRQIEGSGEDDYDDESYDYDDDDEEENADPVTDIPTSTTHSHQPHHGISKPELIETSSNELTNNSNNKNNNNNNNIDNNNIIAKTNKKTANENARNNADYIPVNTLQQKHNNTITKKIDDEIVESVSQLESVITKTIENTNSFKDLLSTDVDEGNDEDVDRDDDNDEEINTQNKKKATGGLVEEQEVSNAVGDGMLILPNLNKSKSKEFVISATSSPAKPNIINTMANRNNVADLSLERLNGLTASANYSTVNVNINENTTAGSTAPSILGSEETTTIPINTLFKSSTQTSSSSSPPLYISPLLPLPTSTSSPMIVVVSSSSSTPPSIPVPITASASASASIPLTPTETIQSKDEDIDDDDDYGDDDEDDEILLEEINRDKNASAAAEVSPLSTTTTTTTTSTYYPEFDEISGPSELTTLTNGLSGSSPIPATTEITTTPPTKPTTTTTTTSSTTTATTAAQANIPVTETTTTTETVTTSSTTTTTTTTTEYVEPKIENFPPMIKTRLQKFAVTSGKAFRYIVPADTFYDTEDLTNLRLELTDKDGHELEPTSWLQFNAETHEIYGLPLDDAVSKWQYRLSATDSGNLSVTETLEMSVQQHRGVRSVNHEINIAVKINEKNMPSIDWQLKLIEAIATTLGDESTTNLVVREIRQTTQDPNTATFIYFNETLPSSGACPDTELNSLIQRLDANRLLDLVSPNLSIKSITGQLIGPCQKQHPAIRPRPPTHMSKNLPPVPRNQVDRVNATVGHLLVFKVPSDTFYDPNDNELTLMLRTKDNKILNPRHWLQFDSKNQEFYGIPKSGDIGSEEYLLVAEDSGGLSATDALVVVVNHAPKKDFSVYFKAYLAIRHEQFNADLQRKFVERVAKLFGDRDTHYIQIRSITTHHDADGTIVNFYNTTLHKAHNRCPEEEIDAARNVYLMQDYRVVRDRVKQALGAELNLTNVEINTSGSCSAQTNVIHHDVIPTKTEEPTLKSTFADNYMFTFIVPAVIIVTLILVAAIIACCLHRRRMSGKMELGDEEERKAFRPKGIPVIFQDEFDEKPEIGNKSPIILKDEKPPLLPPSYNTSNMNGGDNDVDEYLPPPAVVVGGREARGKSPATPSYRKPPPYVSP